MNALYSLDPIIGLRNTRTLKGNAGERLGTDQQPSLREGKEGAKENTMNANWFAGC